MSSDSNELAYTPPPTVRRFMLSDSRKRVLTGPVGSGKSVGCVMEIVHRAARQAPSPTDGMRRTRALVIRNTYKELNSTTIKTFLDWLKPDIAGTWHKTDKLFTLRFDDVECEVVFLALDTPDDVAKLLSLEASFAWLNECREIHQEIVEGLQKRVGRYPATKDGGCTWYGVWGDTNPPVMDSWWYRTMEHVDGPSGWEVFKQPGGRSPQAENVENLPPDYYSTEGFSDDYIRVYIDGQYGRSMGGRPVFEASFVPEYHIASGPLHMIRSQNHPLIVGLDLGLTPAAVIGQNTPTGAVSILRELTEFNMGLRRFVQTRLKPLLHTEFRGQPYSLVIDPAGRQRAQTDEKTAFDILKAENMHAVPARANDHTARIGAVESLLSRQTDGKAAVQIDPSCSMLIQALRSEYKFKDLRNGGYAETPEKNQWSHVAEAFEYFCMHIESGSGPLNHQPRARKVVKREGVVWV